LFWAISFRPVSRGMTRGYRSGSTRFSGNSAGRAGYSRTYSRSVT
jgi:hypothetical protein